MSIVCGGRVEEAASSFSYERELRACDDCGDGPACTAASMLVICPSQL